MNMNKLFVFFLFMSVFVVLPALVFSECTCNGKEDASSVTNQRALGYKLAAIGSILVAGTLGVCLPILGKAIPSLRPEKDVFLILKTFAAGVILATGFIHVLPDAFENLTSPCLPSNPWGDFPFTGFVAMVAAIGTLMIDTFAMTFYQREGKAGVVASEENACHVHVHTYAAHGHTHASDGDTPELHRSRVISQVLELGIVAHSIIIGIALGASQSPETIRPLIAALSFHQFFEGMGLGGCISQARFEGRVVALMSFFFSVTTPAGIAIGIGISSVYDENGPTALIMEGVFNAASAGILIYMALVDLLAADFMSSRMRANFRLHLACYLALLLGAAAMSLLAKWA